MGTAPLLSIRNLRTEFKVDGKMLRAVDGLSYDLDADKTIAIVGESGSGKSVHALSLLRLLPKPQGKIVSGEILFQGLDLLQIPEPQMREIRGKRIAMVFQEPMTSLNPVLTIGEQIAETVLTHQKLSRSEALDKAMRLLEKVGIPKHRIQDYPHQFSGGMRQRAMLAIALCCEPQILIADEPTTALDVTIQAQILDLIGQLQKELHMAVILITHNLGLVARLADEVLILYAGRAVEKASTAQIFAKPKHPYTQGLLASLPPLFGKQKRLKAIEGQPPEPGQRFIGCPFALRCPQVMEECRHNDPPNYYLQDQHWVNCWLYRDQAQ